MEDLEYGVIALLICSVFCYIDIDFILLEITAIIELYPIMNQAPYYIPVCVSSGWLAIHKQWILIGEQTDTQIKNLILM